MIPDCRSLWGPQVEIQKHREGKEPWQWNKGKRPKPKSQKRHSQTPSWDTSMENLGNYYSLLVQELVFVFPLGYACSWFNVTI